MARVRSPNFPAISLPAAIERIEKIYSKEQTIPASKETVAEHLGYSGMNGASLKVVSALLKYGLLEETKDKNFRVSPLAMAIMHPASEEERADALRQAADGPALFQRLNAQFDGRRPSDTNLRSWLLRNGFASSAVDSVIVAYSETMDLVGGVADDFKAPDAKALETSFSRTVPTPSPTMTAGTIVSPPRFAPAAEPFSVELMRDRFRVVGELATRADALKLIDILTMAAKLLPETVIDDHRPHFAESDSEDYDL
jgi:hypothetical protein